MRFVVFLTLLLPALAMGKPPAQQLPIEFRFHILREPATLDPVKASAAGSSFVLFNLYRGYTRYRDQQGLVKELGDCHFKAKLEVRCRFNKNAKYANGQSILIDDYLRPFFKAFGKDAHPDATAELVSLKNAKAILEKKMPAESLGVQKISDHEIAFLFDEADHEFIHRLSAVAFSPVPATYKDEIDLATNYATGPFRLKEWQHQKFVLLEPNLFYSSYSGKKATAKINVKALIVSEDTTALRLFQTGQLDYLRRVPAEHYDEIKKLKEFSFKKFARMDYIGFADKLANEPELTEALGLALDYKKFREVFHAFGEPGCFGLPATILKKNICLKFDPKRAREIWQKLSDEKKSRIYKFLYSTQGGDDILRTVQWFQGQWKENLGINIELQGDEQAVLTAKLRDSPPDMFRRGVPLERATCVAALDNFTKGNPDNYLKINRLELDQKIAKLAESDNSQKNYKLCEAALSDLLATHRLIPLGQIHFMTLLRRQFKGVEVNALNQLDLSALKLDFSLAE